MGSYCSLQFDEIEIISKKSSVPDFLISLFQSTDRKTLVYSEDEVQENTGIYTAPRRAVEDRLNIMGFTSANAERAFDSWRTAKLEMYHEWTEDDHHWAIDTYEALKELSYEDWKRRAYRALQKRYDFDNLEHEFPLDKTDTLLRDVNEDWLFFESVDPRLTIRALLDACIKIDSVSLDVSDLIDGGWIAQNEDILSVRRRESALERPELEPVVILAEGSTDIHVLKISLQAMYPHLVEYFSFFDHHDLNVDGGSSYLVKFSKAFAAARIASRVIAVFDNDAAGIQGFRELASLRLPENIKTTHLPDTELARAYPSIGPQGRHTVDVNGRAAGIELYLGRASLTTSEGMRPIRWVSFNSKVGEYQGEIDGKAAVMAHFENSIGTHQSAEKAREAHPELAAVWEMIFSTVQSMFRVE